MRTRLILAVCAFGLSLLVVVPAPNMVLWIATILVTAWSQWFFLAALILLGFELYLGRGHVRIVTSLFLGGVLVLESLPFAEDRSIANLLPQELSAAFGPASGEAATRAPLQLGTLWWSCPPLGRHKETLHFTTSDGTALAMDFFSDDTAGARPCIVVVHGGSWHGGTRKELQSWDRILSGLGYRVVSIEYRLAPQFTWPAQKQDLLAALDYLKANASRLGIDPGRFVLLGRSAGAQIVLATAYAAHDTSIRGCIASYPPADMNFDYKTAGHSLLDAHKTISQFLGGTPEEKPELYRDASAFELADAASPPTLLAHGSRDELVWIENSRKLRDHLKQLHRPVFLLELPLETHGFDANPNGPGGQLEAYDIERFLAVVAPLGRGANR